MDLSKIEGIIDVADAEKRLGTADIIFDLLPEFISVTEDFVNTLKDAVLAGDDEKITEISHSIKGSASNLSLIKVQEAAYNLEAAGKKKDKSQFQPLFRILKASINELAEIKL